MQKLLVRVAPAVPLLWLLAMPAAAQVTLYGTHSNFDVVNDTPACAHGFEIEFHGVSNITSYFNWNRYGMPQVTPFPAGGGLYVRWMSPYDPSTGKFTTCTPPAVKPTILNGHQCIIGTALYTTSGCEHFGISVTGNATKTIYRWLVADPANPGKLTGGNSQVAIPAPVWSVEPPAQPGGAPVVRARMAPPAPAPPAKRYGPAQWMKTFKMEHARQVNLDELVPDNAAVPEDPEEVEIEWELLQTDNRQLDRQVERGGNLGRGNRAVVRRFEIYKYTGAYDPLTNEALCSDLTCDVPAEHELGDFVGAQNAAANLNVPATFGVAVTVAGAGDVRDATGVIRCPSSCSTSVAPGTQVTLTAKASKSVFTGWSGACAGTNPTCTFAVDSDATATATFKSSYKLVLKTNGSGSVSNAPAGSTFVQGTAVTVTAAPPAGSTWKGWSGGGCSGLGLSCTVVIQADTTLTANFR